MRLYDFTPVFNRFWLQGAAMKFVSSVISLPAGFIVLLAFFLPWITVSCSGASETVTGYDMATGVSNQDTAAGYASQESDDAHEYLWLIPAAGAGVLVAAYLRHTAAITRAAATRAYAVLGVAGLAVQIYEYFKLQSDLSDIEQQIGTGLIALSYEAGWWLSLLALIAVLVAAFVANSEQDYPAQPAAPTPHPPGTSPPGI
jgi:hypothetical protein